MLKLAGACLILAAGAVFGFQMKQRLAEHVQQLIGLKEMLLMLSGEMSYAKAPLTEAFRHIAVQGKAPFDRMLTEVSEGLEQERDKTLQEIWEKAVFHHKEEFFFSAEEFQILTGLGKNLGYLDIQMQMNHISLYLQQVEGRIVQAQNELAAKQKMYQYLSVMSGLFLILILI